MTESDGMMHVVDIHDPFNPKRLGSYDSLGFADGVALSEAGASTYAYIAGQPRPNGIGGGLQVVDVSDPANPKRLGGYGEGVKGISKVIVSGNLAYSASSWGSNCGLETLDVSDPAHPRRIGAMTNAGTLALALAGQHLYALTAGGQVEELQVIDVRDPVSPQLLGVYQTEGRAYEFAVSDGLAYMLQQGASNETNASGNRLLVIDVSYPSAPKRIGAYACDIRDGFYRSIAISGHYAYLLTDSGLDVLDISDPRQPRKVGKNSAVLPGRIVAANGYLFAAPDYQGELVVLDLFRPFRLGLLGRASSRELRLKVDGPRGVKLDIERSSNVNEWQFWRSITLGGLPTKVSDPEPAAPQCFYRAIVR